MKMNTTKTPKTHCEKCNAAFPSRPHTGATSGYAITPKGIYVCYACADAMQREELKDRSKSFFAYVSSDGKRITTWTGGTLMTVTQSWPCQLTRSSHSHDSRSYKCIRATDVHGGRWYGRGSAGVCIKMRPVKAA